MTHEFEDGIVVAVHRSPTHEFSKPTKDRIRLLAALGVEGDAHLGTTVKHRSRVAKDPSQPNLRQVHLIHDELIDELRVKGFRVAPEAMGENITTRGIDLLSLPSRARLHIGQNAVIEITGLRNPCRQLNDFQPGLMAAVLDREPGGQLIRKAGVMGIVLASGDIRPGDRITVEAPPAVGQRLEPV
jgi:MOSC domain-containing protein YiiM